MTAAPGAYPADRPSGSRHPDQVLIGGFPPGCSTGEIGQIELALAVAGERAAHQQAPGPPGGAPSCWPGSEATAQSKVRGPWRRCGASMPAQVRGRDIGAGDAGAARDALVAGGSDK